MESKAKPRVVIVGAGFGGLATVQALKKVDVDITVIDKTNHHLFQPLLYQVATAALSPADIAAASRSLLGHHNNVTVLMAEVVGVDPQRNIVCLQSGETLPYDYLILATGAAYSYFGRDEWRAKTQVLKTLDDALAIRERLLSAFEAAEKCKDPATVNQLLTFVVIGGGPTGVEMAGAIAELARTTLQRDFKQINPSSARVVLCHAMDRLLPSFPRELSEYSAKALEDLGVEVRLRSPVVEIDDDGISLGTVRIDTQNVIWCAGTEARPAAKWLGAPASANGAVKVLSDCSIPEYPNVFAIGDVASFDSGNGTPLPGLAPVAKQQGTYVGKLITAKVSQRPLPGPFRYRNLGTMAVIGRCHAIADLHFLSMSGFPGWLVWSLVHIFLLIDFRSKLLVSVNWLWAWATRGRGARLLTGREKRRTAIAASSNPMLIPHSVRE